MMQSTQLFLRLKKPILYRFLEQNVYLKCAILNLTDSCNFTCTSKRTKGLPACKFSNDHSLHTVWSKNYSSNFPQTAKMGYIHEKEDYKSSKSVKFRDKDRRKSIVTKSNDPDTFGDMVDFLMLDKLEDKIGDESEHHEDCKIFIPSDRKYQSPDDYFKGMKDLVKEKKLKQALDLFLDMRRHLIPPSHSHYTFMIGACGRVGYTEMAFKLLRQMTDRGFKPSAATLTGLFNSCAESPKAEYGLKKAHFLKEKIPAKHWEISVPTYHAMIKAFGRCGDIKTAFEVVDEMVASRCLITTETYNMLLISCISDKEAGFSHVIEVWRKMISKKLRPDLYSYNLLLRAVRDCGIGPEEVSCNLLQHWSSCFPRMLGEKKKNFSRDELLTLPAFPNQNIKLLGETSSNDYRKNSEAKIVSTPHENIDGHQSLPSEANVVEALENSNNLTSHTAINLLLPRPIDGPKFVDLGDIQSPSSRLLLLGGVKGVLESLKNDKVSPDIKTFTLLLKSLPDSTADENELLSLMGNYKLKLDIDFFNILVKKRNFRKDFKASKEVMVLINKKKLHPDIVTFGVLALGCPKKRDGLQLLHDMKSSGFCPNVEIFGGLLNSASRSVDFEYICALLEAMETERIKPSPKILQILENIRKTSQEKIQATIFHVVATGIIGQLQSVGVIEYTAEIENLSEEFSGEISNRYFSEKSYNEFCQLYEQWLKIIDVEEEVDPWHQYKTEIKDCVHEKHLI